MIDLELWRARIGLFQGRLIARALRKSAASAGKKTRAKAAPDSQGLRSAVAVAAVVNLLMILLTATTIASQLLMAGDVEPNPGPETNGWWSTKKNYVAMYCMSAVGVVYRPHGYISREDAEMKLSTCSGSMSGIMYSSSYFMYWGEGSANLCLATPYVVHVHVHVALMQLTSHIRPSLTCQPHFQGE